MIDDLGGKGDVVAQFYSPINALARRDAVAEFPDDEGAV